MAGHPRQHVACHRLTLAQSSNEDAPFMRGFSPPATATNMKIECIQHLPLKIVIMEFDLIECGSTFLRNLMN